MACYRVFKVFLTVCFSVFLLAGTLFARSGDPMYDFYDGLNKVMERNAPRKRKVLYRLI